MGAFILAAQQSANELVLLVNCQAGISRSGAVVSFVRDVIELDSLRFQLDNGHIAPNFHVRRLLFNWWKEHVGFRFDGDQRRRP